MAELYKKLLEALSGHGLVFSAGMFVALTLLGTLAGLAAIVWLPANHFQPLSPEERHRRHPVLRGLLIVLKNLLGYVLLPVGIIMAVPLVPGPGAVFILLGVSLIDFPGRRRLMIRLIAVRSVYRFVTGVRLHFRRPPFALP